MVRRRYEPGTTKVRGRVLSLISAYYGAETGISILHLIIIGEFKFFCSKKFSLLSEILLEPLWREVLNISFIPPEMSIDP
jgi:hypothetical protein